MPISKDGIAVALRSVKDWHPTLPRLSPWKWRRPSTKLLKTLEKAEYSVVKLPHDQVLPSVDETGFFDVFLDNIAVDEASILRIQGYRDLDRIRPKIRNIAASTARETEDLITPQISCRILNVHHCEGKTLQLEDGTTFENEAFQRFLKDVRQIAVFILSMGHALDKAVIDSIAEDQLLRALFLETAGWLGIEAATRVLSGHLRTLAKSAGMRLSPRLGPGYSYKLDGRSVLWPLEQQQILFGVFAGRHMDVELLESCAMLPKISRSGIYGFLTKT